MTKWVVSNLGGHINKFQPPVLETLVQQVWNRAQEPAFEQGDSKFRGPQTTHRVLTTLRNGPTPCLRRSWPSGFSQWRKATYQRWVVRFHTILCSWSVSRWITPLQFSTNWLLSVSLTDRTAPTWKPIILFLKHCSALPFRSFKFCF